MFRNLPPTRHLLVLLPLLLLLAGCFDLQLGPTYATLSSKEIVMRGVLATEVEVNANGAWQLSANAWLSATPSRGRGDTTVRLQVNPVGLQPGEHTTSLTLEGGQSPEQGRVTFVSPKLRGTVVIGPETASIQSTRLAPQSLPNGPGTLLIGLQDEPTDAFTPLSSGELYSLASAVVEGKGAGRPTVYENLAIAAVEVPNMARAARELAADPRVRYVSEPTVLYPLAVDDPLRPQQWNLDMIGADAAWDVTEGAGTTVAVIDTGFYPGHEDLAGNVVGIYDAPTDSNTIPSLLDCDGPHGNHVAGIIAATANNSVGVAGISPQAELLLVNVGREKSCELGLQDVLAAIDWVITDGRADVVNMSLGAPTGNTAFQEAVQRAYEAGITVIAASGNTRGAKVLYPAAFPEVLAVSAVDSMDFVAAYSTTGPEVFLSAPGGSESAAVVSTGYAEEPGEYLGMAGTSMASPAVAAVAALIKSVNPALTPLDVAGILADSSKELGVSGRDELYGYGRLDAGSAVELAQVADVGGLLAKVGGRSEAIPIEHTFELGYLAAGQQTLEVGSDENLNGELGESGELYGKIQFVPAFDSPYVDVQVSVERLP